MKRLILIVAIAVVLAGPIAAQSTDKQKKGGSDAELAQTLLALTRQEDEAEMKRDTATVGRILADDFIVTHPSGAAVTKAEYLKNVLQPPEDYQMVKGYSYEDFKVYRHGDTAVANYVMTMTRQDKAGKEVSERLRPTVVWVKKNGSWQVATFCVTPLTEPTTK